MDFGALPPEINSGRMYAGPGSGPMLAAAAAWDGLATALHTTAASYQAVVSELTTASWRGPASVSMAAAAATYISWLTSTASQAEEAATQARAAAAAYEAAHAMTVPPPVIAANRSLLMLLVATNVLGQNTPAIAATEFHYGEMWAQDAAAMYGYAGASAAASRVTPFSPPPATTDPTGPARQAVAVAQLTSAVPPALRELASPTPGTSLRSALDTLNAHATTVSGHARTTFSGLGFLTSAANLAKSMNTAGTATGAAVAAAPSGGGALGSTRLAGLSAVSGGGSVSAGMGRAFPVGALSAPQAWAAAAPGAGPVSATVPGVAATGAPASGIAGVPVAPLAGMAGRGGARLADASRFLLRPNMVPRWPAGG
ncbi:PPE family protein [Mycobacterium xenopi]|nr:PPE family protein [Mycobacterium xenopi]MDA3639488.1 PPE family protein [Mycobacterium xenopi]MDA3657724.1 PPE family protein [Mycobacterium xenopi]ORX20418.1 hypothetical protein AWC32_06080 [Mycobacterium xenopi]